MNARGWMGRAVSAIAMALLVTSCGSTGDGSGTDRPVVVATTSIAGDLVRNVVGDDARVEVIMGPGVDPHDFAPSAQQAATIAEADLIVAFGLGLESGLGDVIEAAVDSGARLFEIGPAVDPMTSGDEPHAGEEEADDHGGFDPHVWQDPVRMAQAVTLIGAEMSSVAPDVDWTSRSDEYRSTIESLDADVRTLIDAIPSDRRRIVTNHASFGYFADRYGLDVVGVVIPGGSTLAEPSASDLAELVDTLSTAGVNVIFAENTTSTRLAEVLAAELGSEVSVVDLYSDSLGAPGTPGDSYVGVIRSNAETISEALR